MSAEEAVSCEVMLIKVKNDPKTREVIRAAMDAYKAEFVDYTHDSMIMRITGDSRRIDAFITLMRAYNIMEICRTGVVSLERGSKTILENE